MGYGLCGLGVCLWRRKPILSASLSVRNCPLLGRRRRKAPLNPCKFNVVDQEKWAIFLTQRGRQVSSESVYMQSLSLNLNEKKVQSCWPQFLPAFFFCSVCVYVRKRVNLELEGSKKISLCWLLVFGQKSNFCSRKRGKSGHPIIAHLSLQ